LTDIQQMATNKTRFKDRACETAPFYIFSNKIAQNTMLTKVELHPVC